LSRDLEKERKENSHAKNREVFWGGEFDRLKLEQQEEQRKLS
jgi:hypothetical protein